MVRWIPLVGVFLAGIGSGGCDVMPTTNALNVAALAESITPTLSFTALAANGQLTYSASIDTTSINLQNALRALGLPVSVTQDPVGNVRIASSTPDGSRFTLVVSAVGGPSAAPNKETHVSIEWDKPADGARGIQILVQLEAEKKTSLVK
jgi:hypothetical protein